MEISTCRVCDDVLVKEDYEWIGTYTTICRNCWHKPVLELEQQIKHLKLRLSEARKDLKEAEKEKRNERKKARKKPVHKDKQKQPILQRV